MQFREGFGLFVLLALAFTTSKSTSAQRTTKPVLHGKHWIAITGKPLAATAGAITFARGGNAVDAACAMLAAASTMWDSLAWGGETQALIYNPNNQRVKGINALGVAPTGANQEFFRDRNLSFPPEFGPLAAVTPGTPGGLMVMLAEFGTLSLREVLEPAMEMARGYPIEESESSNIERDKKIIQRWSASRRIFLPNFNPDNPEAWSAPIPGEVFRQPELLVTLGKLIEAESQALEMGKNRREAIFAAYDRFYKGDIAQDLVQAVRAEGGLLTLQDLDQWKVHIEDPVVTDYKGIRVYKLAQWAQGPVMLQALNILKNTDLKSMGYNSTKYIHTLYQVMNLAFADRDFYYGDPYFPPIEPMKGLLSSQYAFERYKQINWAQNDPNVMPGDPYPFQGEKNPFLDLLADWPAAQVNTGKPGDGPTTAGLMSHDEAFAAGTTSIQAADAEGWVVSVTPSGGWTPAFIAGNTGIGLSQRMQSFVLEASMNPFNVIAAGKRPRATLTPGMAFRNGRPYLSFAVQGGDTQDQNLLQFFLNVVEFGMNVQEAAEAANINSYQMRSSFGTHESQPGRIVVREDISEWVRFELTEMGYHVETESLTSGPITAIFFDQRHGTMWGGASDFGEDYGIAW